MGSSVKRAGRSDRGQAKHDTHLLRVDLDSLHKRANEVTAHLPVGILQAGTHLSGKLLQLADEEAEVAFDLGLLLESLCVHFQPADAFAQASDTGLKLRFVNQALRIAIDQACHSSTQSAQLCLQLVAFLWR